MPTETGLTCRLIPSGSQQTTCECRALTQMKFQNKKQKYSSHEYERQCIYLHSIDSKVIDLTPQKLHKHSWLSSGFHQTFTAHILNLNKMSLFDFRRITSKTFQKQSLLFYPYFLYFVFLFLALFFVSSSNAVSLGNTQSTLISNRTNIKLIGQENSTLESDITEILEPSLRQPSFKVKRASEVNRQNLRRKKNESRSQRRRKGEKKTKRGRGRKKSKISSTPFPPDIGQHHGLAPNDLKNGASPRRQRLYNKNGVSYHLAVWKNGTVSGEKSNKGSPYSLLEIRGINEGGIVSIMGVQARKYICVTKKGVVKAKKRFDHKRCRFKERILQNHQNTYQSLSCNGCYLNLRKNGKVKRLKKANPRLTQAHFLPRVVKNHFKRLQSKKGKVLTVTFPSESQATLSDDVNEEKLPLISLNEHPKRPSKLFETQKVSKKSKKNRKIDLKRRTKSKKRFGSKKFLKTRRNSTLSQTED